MEYAIEAIKLGSTAIGICTPEGIVLAVEKRITSVLMEPTTIEKIVQVDKHIGNWFYNRSNLKNPPVVNILNYFYLTFFVYYICGVLFLNVL